MIFDGESVRGIIGGTKVMTRRVVKPQPMLDPSTGCWCWKAPGGVSCSSHEAPPKGADKNPYGEVGDRIWVRESYRFPEIFNEQAPSKVGDKSLEAGWKKPWSPVKFEADDVTENDCSWGSWGRLRMSMHMPRWLSRLTLQITEVRAALLWSIAETDAKAEGVALFDCNGTHPFTISFASRWDNINAARGFPWVDNPWVWIVGFRRMYPVMQLITQAE